MPKIVTEQEKAYIKEAMYKEGLRLIKEKGLMSVTVDDVVHAVGIAKGTFYAYYKSKEEFLYSIRKRTDQELMERMLETAQREGTLKSKVVHMFTEAFLGEDNPARYIKPVEADWLLKKLPETLIEEQTKAQNNIDRTLTMLGITPNGDKNTTLSYLADCMLFVSTMDSAYYDEKGRNAALEILANAIGDYICGLAEESAQGVEPVE